MFFVGDWQLIPGGCMAFSFFFYMIIENRVYTDFRTVPRDYDSKS